MAIDHLVCCVYGCMCVRVCVLVCQTMQGFWCSPCFGWKSALLCRVFQPLNHWPQCSFGQYGPMARVGEKALEAPGGKVKSRHQGAAGAVALVSMMAAAVATALASSSLASTTGGTGSSVIAGGTGASRGCAAGATLLSGSRAYVPCWTIRGASGDINGAAWVCR